eukprot:GHVT01018835.1.p1 GENE.GHVT01018835.1~~GHVT01018835.1.p1  ORF type:complete len:292 (+),score=41.60 GHVT01018835.1:498-1373(+)
MASAFPTTFTPVKEHFQRRVGNQTIGWMKMGANSFISYMKTKAKAQISVGNRYFPAADADCPETPIKNFPCVVTTNNVVYDGEPAQMSYYSAGNQCALYNVGDFNEVWQVACQNYKAIKNKFNNIFLYWWQLKENYVYESYSEPSPLLLGSAPAYTPRPPSTSDYDFVSTPGATLHYDPDASAASSWGYGPGSTPGLETSGGVATAVAASTFLTAGNLIAVGLAVTFLMIIFAALALHHGRAIEVCKRYKRQKKILDSEIEKGLMDSSGQKVDTRIIIPEGQHTKIDITEK